MPIANQEAAVGLLRFHFRGTPVRVTPVWVTERLNKMRPRSLSTALMLHCIGQGWRQELMYRRLMRGPASPS